MRKHLIQAASATVAWALMMFVTLAYGIDLLDSEFTGIWMMMIVLNMCLALNSCFYQVGDKLPFKVLALDFAVAFVICSPIMTETISAPRLSLQELITVWFAVTFLTVGLSALAEKKLQLA